MKYVRCACKYPRCKQCKWDCGLNVGGFCIGLENTEFNGKVCPFYKFRVDVLHELTKVDIELILIPELNSMFKQLGINEHIKPKTDPFDILLLLNRINDDIQNANIVSNLIDKGVM